MFTWSIWRTEGEFTLGAIGQEFTVSQFHPGEGGGGGSIPANSFVCAAFSLIQGKTWGKKPSKTAR